MPSVFITRNLLPGRSPLLAWSAATGHPVQGQSLLRFAPVSFAATEGVADWWFFYSPRAVEFSAEQFIVLSQDRDRAIRTAAMGPGTARALEERGLTPDFVGEGSPAAVATAFGAIAGGATVFFPRARQSRRTVQTLLNQQITVSDAVCYDNVPAPVREPIAADVFVFTSPLNVAAYLDHQPLPSGSRVMAIGPSTAAALVQRGIEVEMTERPEEEAVVEALRNVKRADAEGEQD